jgi:transketolase C-terminal domain/subunit
MKILGIPDEIPIEGESKDVFRHYKLTPEGIAEVAHQMLQKA